VRFKNIFVLLSEWWDDSLGQRYGTEKISFISFIISLIIVSLLKGV
ncbi:uncharacterized protein METZ01_LOCUS140906, partial [marine metagenome]